MLTEALTALAAAGGTAVVQAAGTDAWEGFRHRLAQIFSRGDTCREQAELEHLDRTAAALDTAPEYETAAVRCRQEGIWQSRFEVLLEGLDEPGQRQAADELQALLAEYGAPHGPPSYGPGSLTAGRDIRIRGGKGGITAGTITGGVRFAAHGRPDPLEK